MDFGALIGQVGFPIAVAAWLLVKFEAKLEAAEDAARELAVKLDAHTERCDKCRSRCWDNDKQGGSHEP